MNHGLLEFKECKNAIYVSLGDNLKPREETWLGSRSYNYFGTEPGLESRS